MTTELVPLPADDGPPQPQIPDGSIDLVELALTGLKPQSREGYLKDFRAFAGWAGPMPTEVALWALIRLAPGPANATVMAYVEAMRRRELAPATIRRRVAALVRAVARARRVGLTTLTLEADLPKAEALRDTAGPGKKGWTKILEQGVAEAGDPRGWRNLAVLLLLHDRALRRGEVAGLDWPEDFDPGRPAVQVLGKGRLMPEWLTINQRTSAAIEAWIGMRGEETPGPLFIGLDNSARSRGFGRLSGKAINDLVKAVAGRAGLSRKVTAHALRHQSITSALEKGWDVREVKHFSRHQKIDTVLIYDDNRKDFGGEITRDLGGSKSPRKPRG